MKLFVVIACVCLAACVQALTDEQKEKVKGYFKDCVASSGANPDDVKKSRDGQFSADPKVNEFTFCFLKKAGFMNEAGEIQTDVIKAKLAGDLKQEELNAVVQKCSSVSGKDSAEKAANLYKCYWESTPNHISLTN